MPFEGAKALYDEIQQAKADHERTRADHREKERAYTATETAAHHQAAERYRLSRGGEVNYRDYLEDMRIADRREDSGRSEALDAFRKATQAHKQATGRLAALRKRWAAFPDQ